jgi:AraC family transcriptional regulator
LTQEDYYTRFRPVLDYIDAHLADDLSCDRLSPIAAFSKYHFHRQFSALFGMTLYQYIQLNRFKRSAYQLAFRQSSILDIAIDSGYETPESFARAFKKSIGQTPSDFRKHPQWASWHSTYESFDQIRSNHMKSTHPSEQVKIITFNSTKVAVLEHHGDPRTIGTSIRNFIEWRKQNHLSPKVSDTFNILYNNPNDTAPEDYRLDLCVATELEIVDNAFGIISKTIPGGKCAVLRHVGSDDRLSDRIHDLYATWLPQSNEEPRDFPLYLQRVSFFPDVPEQEAIVDIFLPLM